MSYKSEIEKFVIEGYKNNDKALVSGKHNFVLNDKIDNFITVPPKNFKYHMWASSLKSSQAFAYNIFSGVKDASLKFEFEMKVFDRAAQVDVKLENLESNVIELFEVKAFEICNLGLNKIVFKDKYYTKNLYVQNDIADQFINFLNIIIHDFENQRIYGSGIKQLCSHLLGIINISEEAEYKNKKIKLYSLCFDKEFTPKFKDNLENYKDALKKFKTHTDKFLKDNKLDKKIEYCGFLSATEYVNNNKKLLGDDNYKYVLKRYLNE